jgi:hypothetical protein
VSDQSIEQSGQIVRAQAPASGVSVPAHLGVGSDLVHSLDYVVILQIMFNLASGVQSTPLGVWEQLQARGIRSAKNARELVGKNAVYESFARLLDAGYLRRQQLPHPKLPGRKGPVVYETYDNPAWNPDWQARQAGTDPLEQPEEKPQVGTLPGTPDPSFGEAGETAGGNASRNAGSVVHGSGVPGSVNGPIPAGRNASLVPGSGIAPPPHPPEEEDSSSPYPLTDGAQSHPAQADEGASDFSKEETAAAERFLQQMKRWQAGALTARKCAPRLLRSMRAQGWPALAGLDDEHLTLLEAEILKNTGGAKSWTKCLPGWVDDLRLYERVRSRTGSTHGGGARERCPDHPARYRTGCIDCAMAVPA